jgi:hypothetical protein
LDCSKRTGDPTSSTQKFEDWSRIQSRTYRLPALSCWIRLERFTVSFGLLASVVLTSYCYFIISLYTGPKKTFEAVNCWSAEINGPFFCTHIIFTMPKIRGAVSFGVACLYVYVSCLSLLNSLIAWHYARLTNTSSRLWVQLIGNRKLCDPETLVFMAWTLPPSHPLLTLQPRFVENYAFLYADDFDVDCRSDSL